MKYILTIVLLTVIVVCTTQAQDNVSSCKEAKDFFESFRGDCKSNISAHECVHLDVTDSYDFQGKEFKFQWNMGDGTILEGMEVNHCYENPGRYQAILSLIDPITKIKIDDEATVNIIIKGKFSVALNLPEQIYANDQVEFTSTVTYPHPVYNIDQYYWHFGTNTFSCEEAPTYVFQNPGMYKTDLIVLLSSGNDKENLCISDTVTVKLPDPSRGLLKQIFDSTSIESRFLADNVHYKVLAKHENKFHDVTDSSKLQGGITYKILAYRGSIVFNSPEIYTVDLTEHNQVTDTINAQAIKLARSVPDQFKSLFFELDQNKLSKRNKKIIKKNIDLLDRLPMLQLGIGVYTNSKGSLDKGIELSKTRAHQIKDYMIENGVDEGRIVLMDPNNNRSLINSCITGRNCDYADPDLDRRADFKILNNLYN